MAIYLFILYLEYIVNFFMYLSSYNNLSKYNLKLLLHIMHEKIHLCIPQSSLDRQLIGIPFIAHLVAKFATAEHKHSQSPPRLQLKKEIQRCYQKLELKILYLKLSNKK